MICKWPFKMEAAGIEPASRDASTRPSTCVVKLFVTSRRCLFASHRTVWQVRWSANSNRI